MPVIRQSEIRNHLLGRLLPADFALLAPHLAPVALASRDALIDPDRAISRTYFIEAGIASVVAPMANGQQAEVGLIGREGMVDVATALGGDTTPLEVFVQAAGSAYVLPCAALREAELASASLRAVLLAYAQSFIVQVAYTAVATASMTINERLARWLLMCHDRLDDDEIPITHEFLSLMLNVRRAGVTVAVRELEASGAVEARRGSVVVLDRDKLLASARDSYGIPEATYAKALAS